MKAAECWVGWRGERNTEGEGSSISRHACVGSSQSPPVPWDATSQPGPAQCSQKVRAVSGETRTRHILMCDVNCKPFFQALLSPTGFCLLLYFHHGSFVVNGLLCIVDVRLMAKETIPHCHGENKPKWTPLETRNPPLYSSLLWR